MIVMPKNRPVVQGLNSFFLNVGRFVEHFSGEVSTAGIHFHSNRAEGVIFIDEHSVLNGIFSGKNGMLKGSEAVDHLIQNAGENTWVVSVYEIGPEQIHYWSNLPNAELIHGKLSTEFTDLKKLIIKMQSEKLTGYVEVTLNSLQDKGAIFLNMGSISGALFPWNREKLTNSRRDMEKLITTSEKAGGEFNVYQVKLINNSFAETVEIARNAKKSDGPEMRLAIIEELLNIFENTFKSNHKGKAKFKTLLRRKFVEKADQYEFLDPFAAEFQYTDGTIEFSGDASLAILARGMVDCIKEIAEEVDIYYPLLKAIVPWTEKYAAEIDNAEAGF